MDADRRKRQRADLPFLSGMRFHRLLGRRSFPGYIAIAVGNFADPDFPAPSIAVWEQSRHPWVSLPPDTPPQRAAKQG